MPREKIYPSASNASGKPLVAVDTASVSSRGGPRRKRTRRRRRGTFRSQEGRGKPRTVTAGGVRAASAAPQLGGRRSWSEPLLCASGSLISHASALAQLWPVFAVEGCGPPATLEREIPLFLLGSRPDRTRLGVSPRLFNLGGVRLCGTPCLEAARARTCPFPR